MRNKKIIFPESRKRAILNCLNHIEENATISADGKPSITMDILIDFAEEILSEYLPVSENFPERTKRGIVFSAQMRWLKYKKTTNPEQNLNLFVRALKFEIANFEKRKSEFRVLMFLNVDPSTISEFAQVNLLGETLSLISWNDVNGMDTSDLWQEVKFQDRNNPLLWDIPDLIKPAPDEVLLTPFLFVTKTYAPEAAVEIASNRMDLFRAILNVPSSLGQYTLFRSQPKALSEFLPSPIYVIFDEHEKRKSIYFTIEKYEYKQKKIPNDRISSIRFLLSKITVDHATNSTWNYLINILRLYQKALDTTTTEAAFLTMWQVLENCIGLGEELTRNRDIQSRLSVFLQADPITLEMIDIIIDKRNRLVHSGKFLEDGDRIFFILKLITDSIIRRFIYLADRYPTLPELKDYVSFSSLGDSDLARKQAVIEKITEERKSR